MLAFAGPRPDLVTANGDEMVPVAVRIGRGIAVRRAIAIRPVIGSVAEVKGKSALALSRDLGVSYKMAFVLLHKLREAKPLPPNG